MRATIGPPAKRHFGVSLVGRWRPRTLFAGYLHAFVTFACYYILFTYIFFIYFYPRSFPAFCEKLLSSDFAAIISYFCMKPYFLAKIKSGYLNIL